MTHDWLYEPCSPESALSPTGQPYPHAVRGLRPQGRRVTGYGQTEPDAYTDARQKAREFDARETLGERGEVRQAAQWTARWLKYRRNMDSFHDR